MDEALGDEQATQPLPEVEALIESATKAAPDLIIFEASPIELTSKGKAETKVVVKHISKVLAKVLSNLKSNPMSVF